MGMWMAAMIGTWHSASFTLWVIKQYAGQSLPVNGDAICVQSVKCARVPLCLRLDYTNHRRRDDEVWSWHIVLYLQMLDQFVKVSLTWKWIHLSRAGAGVSKDKLRLEKIATIRINNIHMYIISIVFWKKEIRKMHCINKHLERLDSNNSDTDTFIP